MLGHGCQRLPLMPLRLIPDKLDDSVVRYMSMSTSELLVSTTVENSREPPYTNPRERCKGLSVVERGEPYETAKAGGRHGAFYQAYRQRRAEEIQRGIRSLARQIEAHLAKIREPERYIAAFAQLDSRQQRALIQSKWPADIQQLQEQQAILQGILQERNL